MESGYIPFTQLFDYIQRHPEIPHKDEPAFDGFRDLYLQLIKRVIDIPGWYAWVNKSDEQSEVVYIGQSQTRKTSSLQARLKEEFLDEFVALWATIHDSNTVVNMLDSKYRGKYKTEIKRSARKAGATGIIWFGKSGLADQQLDEVEYKLIDIFKPRANRKKRLHADSFPKLVSEAESVLRTVMDAIKS